MLVVSLEDDKDELRRRVYAVMRHHQIRPAEVKGWLFLWAPKGLRLAEMADGKVVTGPLHTMIDEAIQQCRIDVLSLDPFIKSHGLDENSNGAIDHVCTSLAKLAIDRDCAIDLPHHTRKGSAGGAGDADRSRGASSMKDAARLVYTLTPMTTDEAEQFGLSEADRRSLIRLDSGKVNISPPSRQATWFRVIGVPLDNGTDEYPHGDEVQTVERWEPPSTWADLGRDLLNRVLDDIDAGLPNGSRYSDAARAGDRAAWRVVTRHAPDRTERQAREIIATWVRSGTLYSQEYQDVEQRKPRIGLYVNAALRPS